ncbi:MAG TPA: prolyl oligopeptidase family serine peptidase [Steroidobacteraceae bacterium]
MLRSSGLVLGACFCAFALMGAVFAASADGDAAGSDNATERDGSLVSFQGPVGSTLQGYLYVPKGTGPFPAILWNHGSEHDPASQPVLARFYTSHGFVFFVPHRHGQGRSPGRYIMDEIRESRGAEFTAAQERANLDVAAALRWLRERPQVDPKKVVISGCSFGGIQAILAAEHLPDARAFIAFAPGAMSWSNGRIQEFLERSLRKATGPVLILQAHNDYSLGPSIFLGKIAALHGGRSMVYPDFGTTSQDGHWKFATSAAGINIWGGDVLAFIAAALDGDRR